MRNENHVALPWRFVPTLGFFRYLHLKHRIYKGRIPATRVQDDQARLLPCLKDFPLRNARFATWYERLSGAVEVAR